MAVLKCWLEKAAYLGGGNPECIFMFEPVSINTLSRTFHLSNLFSHNQDCILRSKIVKIISVYN